MTFFLSYAPEDRLLASAVARGLYSSGLGVFCEAIAETLPSAPSWARRLESAIEMCEGYLVMLSERGLENWVRADLDYVIRLRARREKEGRAFALITLLEGGFTPRRLPGFLSAYPALTLPSGIERAGPEAFGGLAKQLRAALAGKPPPPHLENACPFPGLEAFDEFRGRFLFGRDTEIREAIERLGAAGDAPKRWLQIEGPSGVGKSSFARAGIVPAVRRGWIDGAPKAWRVGMMKPGGDPIRNLAVAFAKALRRELGGALVSPEDLMDDLWKGEGAFSTMLRKYVPAGHGYLLVVDQLEELFVASGTDRSAVRRFDGLLASALRDKEGPLHLITTVRSDALNSLSEIPELEYLLNSRASRYHLKMMTAAGLLSAIEGPTALAGLRCASQLPERLVNETLAADDGLPLLAHTLRMLWNVRSGSVLSHEVHERLGGVSGALNKTADALIDALGKENRPRVEKLFMSLVQIQPGAEDRPRALKRAEAIEAAGGNQEAEQILSRLSGAREQDKPEPDLSARTALITISEAEDRVELAHEVLMRRWKTMRAWIERRRKALSRSDDLEAAAAAWEASGAPRDDLPTGPVLAYLRLAEPLSDTGRTFLSAAKELEAKRESERALEQQDKAESERKKQAFDTHVKDSIEAAEKLLFDIDRELLQVAGAEPARENLSQACAQLLDRLLLCTGEGRPGIRAHMLSHSRRGDLALSRNDVRKARREYEAAAKMAQKLVDGAPNDGVAAYDMAVCCEKLGDIYQSAGDAEKSKRSYGAAIDILEALVPGDAQNTQMRRDLVVVLNKAGSSCNAQNDLASARKYFDKALSITETLANAEPQNAQLRRDLSIAYQMLGTVTRAQGKLAEARGYLEKDLAITKALAHADPRNPQLQRDLSISFEMLGELAKSAGNIQEARAFYEKDLVIMRNLAQADPQNVQVQRDLSMSYEMLGDMLQASGSIAEARACFEKSLEIRKALAKADPYGAQPLLDLVHAHGRLADVSRVSNPSAFANHRDAAAGILGMVEADGRAASNPEFGELRTWISAMGAG